MRFIFVLALAALVSGCATRDYYYQVRDYQIPQTIPDFYEVGEVVEVELVAPDRRVAYNCDYRAYDYYPECEYSPRIRDAIPLRGADGRINFSPGGGGRLVSMIAASSSVPDDTIGLVAARTSGWRIYNTVRLEDDEEITVVDIEDKGFSIGEPVRVGFKNSSSGRLSNRVYLLRSDEEDVVELVERWEPPGPWGRIIPQLERELSTDRTIRPGPGDLLDKDLDLLTEQEHVMLTVSGTRLLGAMEEEYVDFTLGLRSEKDLSEPIEAIFETNLGFGIREAWKDYERHAIPEFASWLESSFLLD